MSTGLNSDLRWIVSYTCIHTLRLSHSVPSLWLVAVRSLTFASDCSSWVSSSASSSWLLIWYSSSSSFVSFKLEMMYGKRVHKEQ